MNYLLDTCVISDFFKKIPSVVSNFKKHGPDCLYISSITVMEIEYGLCLNKEREVKIRPYFHALLNQITTLWFTQDDALIAAKLRAQLKVKGEPIGAYDVLLAATAISNKCTFVTSNGSEFQRVSGISLENWREV